MKKSQPTGVIFISHALLQFKVGIHAWEQQSATIIGNIMCARTSAQMDNITEISMY